MLARILGVSLISAAVAGQLAAQSADSVHYTLAPVMEGGALAGLAVEIRFAGDADGETRLHLPDRWAGSDSLWRHIAGIRVDGAASVREDGPEARVIAHAPRAPLVVRYRVNSAYSTDPGFAYEKAEPIILPGWFFFHGEAVFAEPEDHEDAPAAFAWGPVPAGWTIVSDLDHLHRGQRAGVLGDVIESTAIGATDLAVTERMVGGQPLRIATRPAWSFTPEAFGEAVAAIVQAENELWGDPGRPFVVPLAPVGGSGPGVSSNGTGRSDAFTVTATPNFSLAAASRFLAHEYMHTWIAREVGGLSEGEDEALGYWFSEGFTDFYAGRALLRAGLWTPADFVAELNTTLLRTASSPARDLPNAEIPARFWTDRAVSQLPYDRGHLLAVVLDHRLRQRHARGKDMDDVLHALRAAARQQEAAGPARMDAPTRFPSIMLDQFGVDVSADLERHVDRGEAILLPDDLYGGCATITTFRQPSFSRGFDPEATTRAGNVITGVDPTSPAYAAGLRDGMRLLRRDAGSIGDSSVELVYAVDDGGTERIIRYLPAGKETITFQRVILDPNADMARCARLMSGA